IEVPRKLLNDQKELFVLLDSVLGVIEVNPVYFTEKTAIIKGVEDGTIILAQPVPGAYAGMLVKAFQDSVGTNSGSANALGTVN
ncbi:MAG: efflux transporter periplasmic adaptor subunit, partial [Pricia sp.]